jgi:hypothetical protein
MIMTKTELATSSRRGLLMGLAAAAVVPAPALTTALGNADPVLAAIVAHQAVMRAFSDAVTEENELEEALPTDLRRSRINALSENIVETDDPRWIAAVRSRSAASDKIDEGAIALLEVRPTTMAGMVTLFRYVAGADERVFPDNVLMDDQDDSDHGVDFRTALLLVAAEWLENADSPGA